MKRYVILFLIGLVLTSFSAGSAVQLQGKLALTGKGGLGLPLGDFAAEGEFLDLKKGSAKTVFGFGGTLEFFIADFISVGGGFTYRSFGMKTEDWEEEFVAKLESELQWNLPGATETAVIDAKHQILSFGVFGKGIMPTFGPVTPYLKFGVGMGKLKSALDISGSIFYEGGKFDYDGSIDRDVDIKTYGELGGGILFVLSENVAVTGELLLTRLMTDGADADVDMEVNLGYMGSTVGGRQEWKDELGYNADYVSAFVGLTILLGGAR